MKIVVLNGSPKGVLSITLQYVRFLEKKYPQHAFQVFNMAHDIRKIESDETLFGAIIDAIKEADGVLWAFPLYYFLVSAQYKRFVELIWERNVAVLSKTNTPLQFPPPFTFLTIRPTTTSMEYAMILE